MAVPDLPDRPPGPPAGGTRHWPHTRALEQSVDLLHGVAEDHDGRIDDIRDALDSGSYAFRAMGEWDAETDYSHETAPAVVTHAGQTWIGATDVPVGAEPGVDAGWTEFAAGELLTRNEADASFPSKETTVRKAKEVQGGQVPRPLRAPTLVVERTYPQGAFAPAVVWADGDLVYAFNRTALLKSVDGGATFAPVSWRDGELSPQGTFLRTAAGTLLAVTGATPPAIVRSTNEGVSWTTVHTFPAGMTTLGPQTWDIDSNGDIYVVPYQTSSLAEAPIWRSTDDGATFTTWHTLPAEASSDPDKVRHGHSCQYDPVSDRMFFTFGDTEPGAGIFRTNAARTNLETVVTNKRLADQGYGNQRARAIGLMFFPTHLAWGIDSPDHPFMVRMDRNQAGLSAPTIEQGYRLNSSAFYTQKAKADGSRWLVSSSAEGSGALDKAVHLYAVEDNGATVYEVGSFPDLAVSGFNVLAPVGRPDNGGDTFWLRNHGLRNIAVKARLGHGAPTLVVPDRNRDAPLAWQTATARVNDIAWNDAKMPYVIGQTQVPRRARTLLIFDAGGRRLTGDLAFQVQVVNTTTSTTKWASDNITASANPSQRAVKGFEGAPYLAKVEFGTGEVNNSVQFVLARIAGTANSDLTGYITFGWAD